MLRPSPRLGLADDDVDEGEILAGLVAGLGGAFLGEERARSTSCAVATSPPGELLAAYQERRMELLRSRGFDVSGFEPDQMTSADDVYWFPNLVGPIYPGSAILFRVRPNGRDPDSAIKDTWVLEWPRPATSGRCPSAGSSPTGASATGARSPTRTTRTWRDVQTGMKSRGFEGLRLNPRQESNILHMHRVIDEYLRD